MSKHNISHMLHSEFSFQPQGLSLMKQAVCACEEISSIYMALKSRWKGCCPGMEGIYQEKNINRSQPFSVLPSIS